MKVLSYRSDSIPLSIRRLTGLGFFLMLALQAWAQAPVLTFQSITYKGENIKRHVVLEDHQGFIWLGHSGLYRFDGIEHTKWDFDSLPRFTVTNLLEWPAGILWIGTGELGLIKLNLASGKHFVYSPVAGDSTTLPSPFVTSFSLDSTYRLWVATPAGMGWFDPLKETFNRIEAVSGRKGSLQSEIIRRLFTDSNGGFWVGTYNQGIARLKDFNDGNPIFQNYLPDEGFPGRFILNFSEDTQGNVWVATGGKGLLKIPISNPIDSPKPETYTSDPNNSQTLTSNRLKWVHADHLGRVWSGSQTGLDLLIPETGIVHRLKKDEFNPYSHGYDRVERIYRDRQNNIWFMGFRSTDVLSPYARPFNNYLLHKENPTSKIKGSVYAILEDQVGNLWVGTNKGGLVHIDSKTGVQSQFNSGDGGSHGFRSSDVLDLYQDPKGTLWIATSHGICKTYPGTPSQFSFEFFPFLDRIGEYGGKMPKKGNALAHRVAYELDPDPMGRMYVGTQLGLSRFDPSLGRFENLIDSSKAMINQGGNRILALAVDKKGNAWFAPTQKGLRLLPPSSPFHASSCIYIRHDPNRPGSLSDDFISTVYVDQYDTLWVGTHSALNRLDSFRLQPDTAFYFSTFTREDGLGSSHVTGFAEDEEGGLWLGTVEGLTRYDRKKNKFQNFDKEDGFYINGVNPGATSTGPSGTVYMGSSGGVSAFSPDDIQQNPEKPKVVLTGIQLFNKAIPVGKPLVENGFFLKKQPSYLTDLEIEHRHSVITFEFAALNYFQPGKNQYAYMLDGFDTDWTYCGNKREATYTNLDPGRYTFRVKASNNDGIWNEKGYSLSLVVLPPWYRTWWAYCLYGILLTSLLGGIFYARIRKIAREYETQARIDQAKEEEREWVRKRSAMDFHDEAGNKLTKLSLYAELTRRKITGDSEAEEFVNQIESNLKELATGMRDFIWVLDPDKDSLRETVERINDFGNSLFEHSAISYSFSLAPNTLQRFRLDLKSKRHLLLIFKEAMNNSLKYSNATQAQFTASIHGITLSIIFNDDGIGFDRNQSKMGNGIANMEARAKEIGGNLKIISGPSQGTRIEFTRKVREKAEENT